MKDKVKKTHCSLNKFLSMEVYNLTDIKSLCINTENPYEPSLALITTRGEIQFIRLIEGLVLEIITNKMSLRMDLTEQELLKHGFSVMLHED